MDFLNAARLYHEISMKVDKEEDKLQALNSAVICAILTKAGPQRTKILSQLFKDEHCSKLEIYSALEKMCLGILKYLKKRKNFKRK
jgi:COP9 signalosome complex subunit 4